VKLPFSSFLSVLVCLFWGPVALAQDEASVDEAGQEHAAQDHPAQDQTGQDHAHQDPVVGPPMVEDLPIVVRVELPGLVTYDRTGFLAALGVTEGRPWPDQLDYRAGVKRVWDVYAVVVLRPTFQDAPGGTTVIIPVQEMPVDLEPRFVGNEAMPEEKLREWALLYEREQLYVHEAERVKTRLINGYRRQGFHFVEVDVVVGDGGEAEEKAGAGTDVIFEIREGPKVRSVGMKVTGNVSLPDSGWGFWRGGLRKLAEVKTKGRGMLRWWGATFDREVLASDMLGMAKVYRERGWMDVKLFERLEFNEDRSQVKVHVTVDEGPLYRVREVKLETLDREWNEATRRWEETPAELIFPEQDLRDLLELKPGLPIEDARVQHDRVELGRYYGERGYIPQDYFSDFLAGGWQWLEPIYLFDPERQDATIIYRFVQGRQRSIREVKFRGNKHTRDRVLRRELSAMPKRRANIRDIERGLQRLNGTGFFSDQLDIKHPPPDVHLEQVEDDPDQIDVIYTVTEGRVVDLNLSGGVTSDNGVLGLISLSMRNFEAARTPDGFWSGFNKLYRKEAFHGNGETFLVDIAPGSEISYYKLFYSYPDLFGSHFNRWTINGQFENRLRRYQSHDEERSQTEIGIGHLFQQGDVSFRITPMRLDVTIDDIDATENLPGTLLRSVGDSVFQGVALDLRYSKLDNRLSPRSGVFASWNNVVYGGPFGGQNDIWKSEFQFDWYGQLGDDQKDVRPGVYIGGEFGVAHPFGNTDEVNYAERKFYGGASTLRGFDFRGVGPNQGDFSIGGETFMRFSAEYRHPLYTTPIPGTSRRREMLRGFLFIDTAVLGAKSFAIDLGEYRAAVGFGFALTSPVPLKFNFGFPVRQGEGDDTELFSFRLDFR
jgi:outer membrane protein insertion porin family